MRLKLNFPNLMKIVKCIIFLWVFTFLPLPSRCRIILGSYYVCKDTKNI